ncbi:hypothetical protein ABZ892_12300 [Streptomyces sp. NPDC046924]|uniref:hypothetical protein n=1 Tax=Streptomyces sp. NPDC046924 TaxID=3155136 RepID=UPI0033C49255
MPPTEAETVDVERIVTAHLSSFPYEDEESLYLYDDGSEPDESAAGSTETPFALDRVLLVLGRMLTSASGQRVRCEAEAAPGCKGGPDGTRRAPELTGCCSWMLQGAHLDVGATAGITLGGAVPDGGGVP